MECLYWINFVWSQNEIVLKLKVYNWQGECDSLHVY